MLELIYNAHFQSYYVNTFFIFASVILLIAVDPYWVASVADEVDNFVAEAEAVAVAAT